MPILWPIIPADLKALAEANISPALRQVIAVSISHEQIRQLCLQEAVKVKVQEQTDFQQAYTDRNGGGISGRTAAAKEAAAD